MSTFLLFHIFVSAEHGTKFSRAQRCHRAKNQVLPGIEPGFRDSESPVITVTLQDHERRGARALKRQSTRKNGENGVASPGAGGPQKILHKSKRASHL